MKTPLRHEAVMYPKQIAPFSSDGEFRLEEFPKEQSDFESRNEEDNVITTLADRRTILEEKARSDNWKLSHPSYLTEEEREKVREEMMRIYDLRKKNMTPSSGKRFQVTPEMLKELGLEHDIESYPLEEGEDWVEDEEDFFKEDLSETPLSSELSYHTATKEEAALLSKGMKRALFSMNLAALCWVVGYCMSSWAVSTSSSAATLITVLSLGVVMGGTALFVSKAVS